MTCSRNPEILAYFAWRLRIDTGPVLVYYILTERDSLAQLVEHLTLNQGVQGSSP